MSKKCPLDGLDCPRPNGNATLDLSPAATRRPKRDPPGFLAWWDDYPRKAANGRILRISRAKCLDRWKSRGLEKSAELILSCLLKCKASLHWRQEGMKYTWSSHRFLCERPWEDPGYLEDIGVESDGKRQQRQQADAQRAERKKKQTAEIERRRRKLDSDWADLGADGQKKLIQQFADSSAGKFARNQRDLVNGGKAMLLKQQKEAAERKEAR